MPTKLPVIGVSRREFLELTALGAGVAVLPAGCASSGPTFLTGTERSTLAVLADHVLPQDKQPGGAALGVVDYIERLMTAFEFTPPRIFADGPFSNRNPYPAASGGVASTQYPADAFVNFLPLDRVQEAAWRLKLYGSVGVPGGGPNDAVLGPQKGMRDILRDGVAALHAAVPQGIGKLSSNDLELQLLHLADFRALMVQLTIEGCFCAPEYGGNKGGEGWQIAHFQGDTQPLGNTIYDPVLSDYRENPNFPVSTIDPGPDPEPLDDQTIALFTSIASSQAP